MELYRMLMGDAGKKVISKKLVVVTEDGYDLIEGFPMVIWVDKWGALQAKYKIWNGRIFDSSEDYDYASNPHQIINIK